MVVLISVMEVVMEVEKVLVTDNVVEVVVSVNVVPVNVDVVAVVDAIVRVFERVNVVRDVVVVVVVRLVVEVVVVGDTETVTSVDVEVVVVVVVVSVVVVEEVVNVIIAFALTKEQAIKNKLDVHGVVVVVVIISAIKHFVEKSVGPLTQTASEETPGVQLLDKIVLTSAYEADDKVAKKPADPFESGTDEHIVEASDCCTGVET